MAVTADFIEDFQLPGLDTAKWLDMSDPSGDLTVLPNGGLRLGTGIVNNFARVQTHGLFTLYGSKAWIRVDSMPIPGGGARAEWKLIRADGAYFSWLCDGSTMKGLYQHAGGGPLDLLFTHDYSTYARNFKYLRFRHNQFTDQVFWETSRDSLAWTRRTVLPLTQTNWAYKFRLECGDPASPVLGGAFTIGRVNTVAEIRRGPGYLTETLNQIKLGALGVGAQYGPFKQLTGSGASIIAETASDKAMQLAAPWGVSTFVRTALHSKIRDVDITCDVAFASQVPVPSGQVRGAEDCPKVSWRVQGDTSADTRYRLVINRDVFTIDRASGGQTETLYLAEIGTLLGVTYRWRIVHSGTTIVVYRDGGDFVSTGRHTLPTEVARVSDGDITTAGHVGFSAYSSTATFDNISILPGRVSAAVPRALPFRARTWGAYATRGDYTDHTPMTTDTAVLATLEAAAMKSFPVASWYLDTAGTFPTAAAGVFAGQGKRNLIAVTTLTGWSMASVIAGTRDSTFTAIADSCAALGTETLVRLWPEMNADWSPWSVGYSSCPYTDHSLSMGVTAASQYIAGWRHVAAIFRDRAPNVKLVWCPNGDDVPRTNMLEDYYPGNDWVDVVGFDAYNWGAGADGQIWQTHAEAYRDPYNRLQGINPNVPVWICETGCKEPSKSDGKAGYTPITGRSPIDTSQSKADWVHAMMAETGFANVQAIVLFNSDQQRDWRINSSAPALAAYQAEFTAPSQAQAAGVPDPELTPQPYESGYATVTTVGRYEYLRLEEDGYQPLLISPSLGGLWLQDSDLAFPQTRADSTPRALAPGSSDYTKLTGPRAVSITVAVREYSTATVAYQLDLLARWMQASRRPVLVYKPRGEPERRLVLRPESMSAPAAMQFRTYAQVQLQFVAPIGLAESTAVRVVTLSAADSDPTDAVTYGTAPASAVIRLYGTATNPLVVNETVDSVTDGGARLGLTSVIDSDQFVELNCDSKSAQLNGWDDPAADRRGDLTTVRWFNLEVFRNSLRLTADSNADGSTAAGTATVTYADRYLL